MSGKYRKDVVIRYLQIEKIKPVRKVEYKEAKRKQKS